MAPNDRPDDSDAPRPRSDWGRVADGVFLAGLGLFFLMATTRGLPDGFWVEAISFWPVLLISAGIRIVFEKTPLAAGVVLGPLVVLGTLFWLAWGTPPTPRPPGEWAAIRADRPDGIEHARVRAHLAGVQLGFETRSLPSSQLAVGRVASRDEDPALRLDQGEAHATVRLEGRDSGFMMIGARREVWELELTDAVPLELDVAGVFISTRADLRTGRLRYGELAGAFNAATVRLPRTPVAVDIRVKSAFSAFDITVPEGTPVRFQGQGFPLNFVDEGPASEGVSDEPGYNVILEAAFCALNIEEGPAPEGGWPELPPAPEPASDEAPDEEAGLPAEAPPAPPAEDPEGS
jgi:hypothetical protein